MGQAAQVRRNVREISLSIIILTYIATTLTFWILQSHAFWALQKSRNPGHRKFVVTKFRSLHLLICYSCDCEALIMTRRHRRLFKSLSSCPEKNISILSSLYNNQSNGIIKKIMQYFSRTYLKITSTLATPLCLEFENDCLGSVRKRQF